MKLVILTGSALRHDYFRKALALEAGVEVAASYCEDNATTLQKIVAADAARDVRAAHLARRDVSEQDFFAAAARLSPDRSAPKLIEKGAVNDAEIVREIVALGPDLIVAYGCSIVRDELLAAFESRIVNIHLGLSPYYRGSGTNFWPLVNEEPEYIGATFMHMDQGVDTGRIIHQVRARVAPGDGPHDIGNRLIGDLPPVCGALARGFDALSDLAALTPDRTERYYRKKDFDEASAERLYSVLADGLIDRYLAEVERREAAAPILTDPAIERALVMRGSGA